MQSSKETAYITAEKKANVSRLLGFFVFFLLLLPGTTSQAPITTYTDRHDFSHELNKPTNQTREEEKRLSHCTLKWKQVPESPRKRKEKNAVFPINIIMHFNKQKTIKNRFFLYTIEDDWQRFFFLYTIEDDWQRRLFFLGVQNRR